MNVKPIYTEAFIRSRARMDWSRSMVAEALGLPFRKLSVLLDQMPDVRWPQPHQSVAVKLSRESRRGVATEGLLRAASKAREGRYAKFKKYTIGEHTGTNREIYDIWGDLCSVSYSQIRRRLDRGMNVLDAYFKPNETSKGWGVNKDWGKVPGWLIEARESKS